MFELNPWSAMIPLGYMYKKVAARPEWLRSERVTDIMSISGCISEPFTDYVKYWKHNGYWLFDSPAIIHNVAKDDGLSLADCTLFYYEALEKELDETDNTWSVFRPEPTVATDIEPAHSPQLKGYDVATYFARQAPECSPLSCNSLAAQLAVNRHCLFDTFDAAMEALESGAFERSEPGPFRIIAVYGFDP